MPQIVLEATVVRMASLRQIRPMDDLLKRLMILEKALSGGTGDSPVVKSFRGSTWRLAGKVRPVSTA